MPTKPERSPSEKLEATDKPQSKPEEGALSPINQAEINNANTRIGNQIKEAVAPVLAELTQAQSDAKEASPARQAATVRIRQLQTRVQLITEHAGTFLNQLFARYQAEIAELDTREDQLTRATRAALTTSWPELISTEVKEALKAEKETGETSGEITQAEVERINLRMRQHEFSFRNGFYAREIQQTQTVITQLEEPRPDEHPQAVPQVTQASIADLNLARQWVEAQRSLPDRINLRTIQRQHDLSSQDVLSMVEIMAMFRTNGFVENIIVPEENQGGDLMSGLASMLGGMKEGAAGLKEGLANKVGKVTGKSDTKEVDMTQILAGINQSVTLTARGREVLGNNFGEIYQRIVGVFAQLKIAVEGEQSRGGRSGKHYLEGFGQMLRRNFVRDNAINAEALFSYFVANSTTRVNRDIADFARYYQLRQEVVDLQAEQVATGNESRTVNQNLINNRGAEATELLAPLRRQETELAREVQLLTASLKAPAKGEEKKEAKPATKSPAPAEKEASDSARLAVLEAELTALRARIQSLEAIVNQGQVETAEQPEHNARDIRQELVELTRQEALISIDQPFAPGNFEARVRAALTARYPGGNQEAFRTAYWEFIQNRNAHLIPMLERQTEMTGVQFRLVNGELIYVPAPLAQAVFNEISQEAPDLFGGIFGNFIRQLRPMLERMIGSLNIPGLREMIGPMLADLDGEGGVDYVQRGTREFFGRAENNRAFQIIFNGGAVSAEDVTQNRVAQMPIPGTYNRINFQVTGDIDVLSGFFRSVENARLGENKEEQNADANEYTQFGALVERAEPMLQMLDGLPGAQGLELNLRDIMFFSRMDSGEADIRGIHQQLENLNSASEIRERLDLIRLGADFARQNLEARTGSLNTMNIPNLIQLSSVFATPLDAVRIQEIRNNWDTRYASLSTARNASEFIANCRLRAENNIGQRLYQNILLTVSDNLMNNNFQNFTVENFRLLERAPVAGFYPGVKQEVSRRIARMAETEADQITSYQLEEQESLRYIEIALSREGTSYRLRISSAAPRYELRDEAGTVSLATHPENIHFVLALIRRVPTGKKNEAPAKTTDKVAPIESGSEEEEGKE